MCKSMIRIALALFLLSGIGRAAEVAPKARLDIFGLKEQIKLTPGTLDEGYSQTHVPSRKNGDCILISHSPVLRGTNWQPVRFSFTPEKSGTVSLYLRGPWFRAKGMKNLQEIWVAWDRVKITGAKLENGDFDTPGPNGTPNGWIISPENYLGQDRNPYIVTWYNQSAIQHIQVEAGQEVTIEAQVRPCSKDEQ